MGNLGYDFIPKKYLPKGQNEYYLREKQQLKSTKYRSLQPEEIEILLAHGNFSPNWSDVLVSDQFIPQQIQHSKFYGMVRIGEMDETYLDYRDLHLPTGIYNSVIVSCDIGSHCAIHNTCYMAHFILGDEVILFNVHEMETSSNAKFGNGILKEGDAEDSIIALEICNENGGRAVLPFEGMRASDAFLWSRNRHDEVLQDRFRQMTLKRFDRARGHYSMIGDRTVIKNSDIIKDVKIGTDAYIKGVNKLKNVTVQSTSRALTQIGEGCELVNGIIGHGCRIFYGVKAVRFILSAHSQLKYGARLINSYLGENSTISCCEVLNSLIFPAHEQHHNNSFLCASLIKGQSNMAAGATVGSNHNSRAADGEIIAGRGFWPGLCVSLKHNSRFATFNLIAKGDFPHELDIRLPFAMVSHNVKKDAIVIIPAYWFLYNMYALMRNNSKFSSRDQRIYKEQYYEYDILAPDTVNEMFDAVKEIEVSVGRCALEGDASEEILREKGREWLDNDDIDLTRKEILLENTENSNRKVILNKVRESYRVYKKMIRYYGATQLKNHLESTPDIAISRVISGVHKPNELKTYDNIGGQLVRQSDLEQLLDMIRQSEIDSWEQIHDQLSHWSLSYPSDKLEHAIIALLKIDQLKISDLTDEKIADYIQESVQTKKWICEEILKTRSKDYQNKFRQMVYENEEEMGAVMGKLEENKFILEQAKEFENYVSSI